MLSKKLGEFLTRDQDEDLWPPQNLLNVEMKLALQ